MVSTKQLAAVVLSENDRHRLPIFIIDLAKQIEEMGIEEATITVIDNGSHDGSDEIVEAMAKTISILKLVRFETSLTPTDLVIRALSEVQGEYLLLFLKPGAVPSNLENCFRETGGHQFSSFIGETPRFDIYKPEWWFKICLLRFTDWVNPTNVLSLRTFGVLLHKAMADDLMKNFPINANVLCALRQAFVNLGAISKKHLVEKAPLFGFPDGIWRVFWQTSRAYFLRRRA